MVAERHAENKGQAEEGAAQDDLEPDDAVPGANRQTASAKE